MNLFTKAWRKLTYRTEHSNPDPCTGLHITCRRWGSRTVHDPNVPGYLADRRVRLTREGFDPVDQALLDPATIILLHNTTTTTSELGVRNRLRQAVVR